MQEEQIKQQEPTEELKARVKALIEWYRPGKPLSSMDERWYRGLLQQGSNNT